MRPSSAHLSSFILLKMGMGELEICFGKLLSLDKQELGQRNCRPIYTEILHPQKKNTNVLSGILKKTLKALLLDLYRKQKDYHTGLPYRFTIQVYHTGTIQVPYRLNLYGLVNIQVPYRLNLYGLVNSASTTPSVRTKALITERLMKCILPL